MILETTVGTVCRNCLPIDNLLIDIDRSKASAEVLHRELVRGLVYSGTYASVRQVRKPDRTAIRAAVTVAIRAVVGVAVKIAVRVVIAATVAIAATIIVAITLKITRKKFLQYGSHV